MAARKRTSRRKRDTMQVHPQIQAALNALTEANLPAIESLTAQRARDVMNAMSKARGGIPVPIDKAEDKVAPGPAGDVPVRVYWPNGEGPFPAVIYFHGGGHVFGDLDTHEIGRASCRERVCQYV